MSRTNFSPQHLKLLLGTKLFYRQKRFSQIMFQYIFSLILEFRNLKFPELENWELEVSGTWELRNLGASELGNLFKGIPISLWGKVPLGKRVFFWGPG